MNRVLLLLLPSWCSLCLCGESWAGDWPQFRGPGGAGVGNEAGLPDAWSATEHVRWRADLPGRGVSSPIIVGVYPSVVLDLLRTSLDQLNQIVIPHL